MGSQAINRLLLILVLLLPGAMTAHARDLEVTKKVGDYEIGVKLSRNPPVLGDNPMEIRIKDSSGKPVTDAKVLVNYYMPPMPRMAPMNYRDDAKLKKDKYVLTMNLIMAGPWIIAIKMNRGEKHYTVRFNIDAH